MAACVVFTNVGLSKLLFTVCGGSKQCAQGISIIQMIW
jgi:hypothetical protein